MLHLGITVLHVEHPEQTSRSLAGVISHRLREAGISQREAAIRTGIPLTTLSRRLTGTSPLLVTELASLASVLGVSVSCLANEAEKGAAA